MKDFELDSPVDAQSVMLQRQQHYGSTFPPVEIKSVPGFLGFVAAIACYVAGVYYAAVYRDTKFWG